MASTTSLFQKLRNSMLIIPGFGLLTGGLFLPPGFSFKIIAGLQEAICLFIIGLAWKNRETLKKWPVKFANKLATITLIGFIVSFFLYGFLFRMSTIDSMKWNTELFVPFWANDRVNELGGYQYIYDEYGVDDINEIVKKDCKGLLFISEVIIYTNYLLIFACLTLTFTFLDIKHRIVTSQIATSLPM
ncbi:hypothetical protein [Chitinophaga filiformis]|uniref:Uncharacterized protein n=1 Tax=Chitinophaga filiformis TaxID=104663 RepID=A0ABY4HZ81_CHIFI|nr:hypothetical protein [Chitinophaga filiformis]UPK68728.1 hypothetical protein MYF79_27585 [Chitinophaga filiformis]